MSLSFQLLWLIPALPLLAAAIGSLTPRRGRSLAAGTAIGAMALACVVSWAAHVTAIKYPPAHQTAHFDRFSARVVLM